MPYHQLCNLQFSSGLALAFDIGQSYESGLPGCVAVLPTCEPSLMYTRPHALPSPSMLSV
jgi:hypothetical protein